MTDAEIRALAKLAASHSGQKHARIMADVERRRRDRDAEMETLGLSVAEYDEMASPDPQPADVCG